MGDRSAFQRLLKPKDKKEAQEIVETTTQEAQKIGDTSPVDALKAKLAQKEGLSKGEMVALGLLNIIPTAIGGLAAGAQGAAAGAEAGIGGTKVLADVRNQETDRIQRQLEQEQSLAQRLQESQIQDRRIQEEREFKASEGAKERAAKGQQVAAVKPTEGQKTLDRAFAKRAEQYAGGGRDLAVANIAKLQDAASKLASLKDSSAIKRGALGAIGGQGRALVSSDRKAIEDAINAVTVENLRSTLGAQFTAQENQEFKALEYDPRLPESENAQRAMRKAALIEKKIAETDRLVQAFDERGTIAGELSKGFQEQPQVAQETPAQDPKARLEQLRKKYGR